jgi:hypothetical protein
METDIATYAAGYVLARITLVCAFGYLVFRIVTRSRSDATGDARLSRIDGGTRSVPEDRC